MTLGRGLIPVVIAIFAGVLLTMSAALIVTFVVFTVTLISFVRVPWLPYVVLLASVATVAFYSGWPEVQGIKAPELILAAALLAGGVHVSRMRRRSPSVYGLLMVVFLLTMAGGVYVGVRHGTTAEGAIKAMRPMVFYAALWPALAALANPRSRLVVMRLAAIGATVVVGVQVAQIHAGPERPLFAFSSVVEHVALTPQPDGFLRVRPPGLTLIYVAMIFAATYLLWGPRRRRLGASFVCAVCAVGVLLSLNRNMMLGIVLGLTVAAVIVPRRNRFMIGTFVCGFLVIASLPLLRSEGGAGATGSVVQRVLSIRDVSGLQSGTLSDRAYENRLALHALKQDPITGIGWGTSYGAIITEYREGRLKTEPRAFIHQQYLAIWMRMGLAGLVALLALLGVALASAVRWSRRRLWDDETWLGPAVLASGTAFIASASIGTYLTNPESIVVLMGILGLAYVLREDVRVKEREALA